MPKQAKNSFKNGPKPVAVKLKFSLTKIVQVDWSYASSIDGWNIAETFLQHEPIAIRSVGFLLKHNKKCLTLIMNQAYNNDLSMGLSIPTGWIRAVKVLKL